VLDRVVRLADGIINFSFDGTIASAWVPSESEEGKYYSTLIDITTTAFDCTCMGFTAHKTPCKHVKALAYYLYKNKLIPKEQFLAFVRG